MAMAIYFATFSLFAIIFTREVIAPASGVTCDKRWQYLAGGLNLANLVVVVAAGYLFQTFIAKTSLFDLKAKIDPLSGGLIAFAVSSFAAYWWHRLTHASDFLWRTVHQLHHAPRRVEALTAFYVHPLDSLLAVLLNGAIAYLILGVSATSMAIAMILVTIFNLVAHADQHTPLWLGYFTQRPEMHRVHHEAGNHEKNYGLPIWDMLFGTWSNPVKGPQHCGFDEDKESQIKAMLMFKDVHK